MCTHNGSEDYAIGCIMAHRAFTWFGKPQITFKWSTVATLTSLSPLSRLSPELLVFGKYSVTHDLS
jgi:hypothetical protein